MSRVYAAQGDRPAPAPPELARILRSIELSEEMETMDESCSSYMVKYDNQFYPVQQTTSRLPAGYYSACGDNSGPYLEKRKYDISEFIRFANGPSEVIINEFKEFWTKKEMYEAHGEVHKRGFMLWGPPGGGKTSTALIITSDFIKEEDGIVIEYNPDYIMDVYELFRKVEPDRKVLIVVEDIDTWCGHQGIEHSLLQFLDGNVKWSNTIILATTNFPEKLPDRLINRPSRFDRVTKIGMPGEAERTLYIDSKSLVMSDEQKKKMVKDTHNFTFAHIKEMILSVEIFNLDYDKTLQRLIKMRNKSDSSEQYEEELRGSQKDVNDFIL
tara:strand:- start:9672 stop:10652 length:981 start_codon:yes stop_codon:yes gene_type:complete